MTELGMWTVPLKPKAGLNGPPIVRDVLTGSSRQFELATEMVPSCQRGIGDGTQKLPAGAVVIERPIETIAEPEGAVVRITRECRRAGRNRE